MRTTRSRRGRWRDRVCREVEEGEGGRLQRLIDRIFKNNRVVDTESLCLVPGEQVWSVRVDIHVLDHDGNLVDAAAAAALASLLDYRRPDVTISEGGVHVVEAPCRLASHPCSTAFLRRTRSRWRCTTRPWPSPLPSLIRSRRPPTTPRKPHARARLTRLGSSRAAWSRSQTRRGSRSG